jgi:hypothetical protein
MQASSVVLDEFFRFFRISGMFHCNSGPGAWVIGQGGGASAAGVQFTSANNVLAALVEWVENGIAPETIEGTKFVNDIVTMGVAFQRRHCRSDDYLFDDRCGFILILAIDTLYETHILVVIIGYRAAGSALIHDIIDDSRSR